MRMELTHHLAALSLQITVSTHDAGHRESLYLYFQDYRLTIDDYLTSSKFVFFNINTCIRCIIPLLSSQVSLHEGRI